MTITRAIRRSFRLVPDFREHANTGLEITLRNIFDQFRAQIVGGIKNLIQDSFRTPLEMDRFAAAILGRVTALHPAIIFQTVQQTGESRAFDSHPLRDLLLGKFVPTLREMHKCPPFSLAQAERTQALVELGPPGAGGAEEDETEFVDIRRRHGRELVSV